MEGRGPQTNRRPTRNGSRKSTSGPQTNKENFMRRINILAAAMPLLATSMAMASGGISGSAHDFSRFSWSDGEICKPCHTPHNAIAADLTGRLWNHTLSTASYTLHGASGTGQGTSLDKT